MKPAIEAAVADLRRRLDAVNLTDADDYRAMLVASGQAPQSSIAIIAAADLNALQRTAIDRLASSLGDRLAILVHGPDLDSFDAHGQIIVEQWARRNIDIPPSHIRMVDRPMDQAAAVVEILADHVHAVGPIDPQQVTIGVCDEAIVPHLQQQLTVHGVPARYAAGMPVSRTRPMRLIGAVADWITDPTFANLATLLRHVDVEQYLHARQTADGDDDVQVSIDDWLTLADEYYTEHLHGRITGHWLGNDETRQRLGRVHAGVVALVGALADAARRPLSDWAEPIAQMLIRAYAGRSLRADQPEDRLVIESCEAIHRTLVSLRDMAPELAPPCSGQQALRLVMSWTAGDIPPQADDDAVEMLGPLELHLDDAPSLIMTGVNEGRLPAAVNADPFLPNRLRSVLGLLDNSRRHARDAYAVASILASRPHVHFIAGRRTPDDQALAPSRLLLACDKDQLAPRILDFSTQPNPSLSMPARFRPARKSAFLVPPPPVAPDEPRTSMSVTAFKSYLECRYRFYLGYELRLRHIDDTAAELDGGAFGDLAHQVLKRFGQCDLAECDDEKVLAAGLRDLLKREVEQRFGDDILPAVRVQVEQLARRLDHFAKWQVGWRAKGWRIVPGGVESDFTWKNAVPFDVDGEPIMLTGRIDRVDRHAETGEFCVLDYKTGDAGLEPRDTHLRSGEWVDLQLPLYRHLVAGRLAQWGGSGPVKLGYILLPRDVLCTGEALADWNEAQLEAADAKAREVVRDIRAGRFEFERGRAPRFDNFAEICGETQLVAGEDELDEGGA
jgi:RecB family exonuclease